MRKINSDIQRIVLNCRVKKDKGKVRPMRVLLQTELGQSRLVVLNENDANNR